MCFTNKKLKKIYKPIKSHLRGMVSKYYTYTHTQTKKERERESERNLLKDNPEMQCWLKRCMSIQDTDNPSDMKMLHTQIEFPSDRQTDTYTQTYIHAVIRLSSVSVFLVQQEPWNKKVCV